MPKTKLHLIAHSMGNVVVLNALEKIAQRSASQTRLPLGEVILAHPDVAVDDFKQVARWTGQLRVGMTLYTSRDDRALWLSRGLHGGGRAGGVPVIAAGVDTIDITGLGASLWSANHTVYAANPAVFGDIARLMASSDRPVDKRTRDFERVVTEQGSYWRYRMTATAQK
jgi:esterase/lipase superfamily enzyme